MSYRIRSQRKESAIKRFNCGDVVPGCDFEFRGLDRSAIVERAMEHAARRHAVVADPELARLIYAAVADV